MDQQGYQSETLLTTERELSLQKESVQLLGLDHPIVAAYLRKFRELPPEELGLCVQTPDGTDGVLAAWAVEARGDKGQVKRMIVTLGVDGDGKRHVAWEREPESAVEIADVQPKRESHSTRSCYPPKHAGANAATRA